MSELRAFQQRFYESKKFIESKISELSLASSEKPVYEAVLVVLDYIESGHQVMEDQNSFKSTH